MHFTKAFLALALVAAPIFAAPAATVEDSVPAAPLEARDVSTLLFATPMPLCRQTAQADS